MLVSIFAILAYSAERSYLKDSIGGNWTAEITHPGLPASESTFYQLRVVQSEDKDNFTITIFENENSTTAIDTYLITFVEKEAISFRHQEDSDSEAAIANFTASLKYHKNAIGTYKNYVFNFILGSQNRMDFSIFDHEAGTWTIVHLIQSVPEPTFFGKYGMMIFAFGMMILSIVLRTKFAPKYVPPPQAPKQQNAAEKQPTEQTKKKPKVEVVEEDENEKDNANGDENAGDNENSNEVNASQNETGNTRDDVDENGKVKTE